MLRNTKRWIQIYFYFFITRTAEISVENRQTLSCFRIIDIIACPAENNVENRQTVDSELFILLHILHAEITFAEPTIMAC